MCRCTPKHRRTSIIRLRLRQETHYSKLEGKAHHSISTYCFPECRAMMDLGALANAIFWPCSWKGPGFPHTHENTMASFRLQCRDALVRRPPDPPRPSQDVVLTCCAPGEDPETGTRLGSRGGTRGLRPSSAQAHLVRACPGQQPHCRPRGAGEDGGVESAGGSATQGSPDGRHARARASVEEKPQPNSLAACFMHTMTCSV